MKIVIYTSPVKDYFIKNAVRQGLEKLELGNFGNFKHQSCTTVEYYDTGETFEQIIADTLSRLRENGEIEGYEIIESNHLYNRNSGMKISGVLWG